jgi:peroxiredoxin
VCALEFPDIEANLFQPLGLQGLQILGVSTGSFNETEATLDAFAQQTGVTFPIVHDADTYSAYAWPSALSPFPRQVLIDREGVVRYLASEHREEELRAAVEDVLAEGR